MTLSGAVGLSIVAAAFSTAVYLAILISLDRHEKEPWRLMGFVFGFGAVPAVLLALFAELAVQTPLAHYASPETLGVLFVAVAAPIIEELCKAVPLVAVYWYFRHEFDGLLDGLLYGSLAGFGFAMTENVFYFIRTFTYDQALGWQVVALRAIVFGVNHALYCSCLGLGLAIACGSRRPSVRIVAPLLGLAAGMALHMFHNYSIVTSGTWLPAVFSNWTGALLWLGLVAVALRREGRWIREELAEEVEAGLISACDVRIVTQNRRRVLAKLAAMRRVSAQKLNHYYGLLAELAFKKRQARLHPDDPVAARLVAELRSEIRSLTMHG